MMELELLSKYGCVCAHISKKHPTRLVDKGAPPAPIPAAPVSAPFGSNQTEYSTTRRLLDRQQSSSTASPAKLNYAIAMELSVQTCLVLIGHCKNLFISKWKENC